ncbi:MAG TPA: hypothetical protein VGE74_25880 [Gemmata sp.]
MKILTCSALFLAGAAVLLASGHPSHCNPPPVTGYTPQSHAAPLVVPYYGATYGGPAGISTADGKRIVELLESIDRRLEAIEAKSGGGPLAQKAGPELLTVAKANCASCHTPAKADRAGGGFTLFADDAAGAMLPLSGRQKTAVKQAVTDGTMPPGNRKKLSAEEKAAFKW